MIQRMIRSHRLGRASWGVLFPLLVFVATGCGSMRETFPLRSATEQLLISTAVDRALEKMPVEPFQGKAVWVNGEFMDGYDNKYVISALRRHLLASSAMLAESAFTSDVIVDMTTGGVSIDHRSGLIGIPAIPIPVPFTAEPLRTPELALFKSVKHTGLAKILLTCRDSKTGSCHTIIPVLRGKSIVWERWFLLIGPFRSSTLNEAFE